MIFNKYTNKWGKRLILEQTMLQGFQALKAGLDSAGIQIEMVEGWRGEQEQEQAFKTGHSKAHFGNSPHNFGVAFDICVLDQNGRGSWPPENDPVWHKIGQVGKSAGMTWGGDFKSILDLDHFELTGWGGMSLKLYPEAPPTEA